MPEMVAALAFTHLAAYLAVLLYALLRKRLTWELALWMALIPLFGPLAALLLVRAGDRVPPQAEWMKRNEEKHMNLIAARAEAGETVPLEEALLINDPRQRRSLMMNMLRSDPRKYLDLLLVARFNEDPETAHYATATLMELQRQMQLDIQASQTRLSQAPEDMEARLRYVKQLQEYCDSGLLEGQLLRRQRLLLGEALEGCLALRWDKELMAMAVGNHLALGEAQEARIQAESMISRWPQDEKGYLELLRVSVESGDQQGLKQLRQRMIKANVDLSQRGRERVEYWLGGTA